MRIPMYQVDAFTSQPFAGNPAAVCLLDAWPDDRLLQNIAMENNLSETAFVVPNQDGFDLRWFTPVVEVDLCGHATLASAHVILNLLQPDQARVRFQSPSGTLTVTRNTDLLRLDFPARPPRDCHVPAGLEQALGTTFQRVLHSSRDLMVVLDTEQEVRDLRPDMALLSRLDYFAVMVTAPGRKSDFVSRFFAPRQGIPEDPVTGSAHCTMIPFWARQLGKKQLHARQVSPRGGELWCEDREDRVYISGRSVLVLSGEIQV